RLVSDQAEETVRTAARAGIVQYDGPEGGDSPVAEVGQAAFALAMGADCGPDQLAGRFDLARARLARSAEIALVLDSARLLAGDGGALWAAAI
ncbi:hypothetical protein DSM05_15840, partial [Pseudomonas sp. FW305-3-2-15-E-TSA4]|nr:hypothetical protein [Pseudomonas sp. FW305-3-2-15-E-TSA4]